MVACDRTAVRTTRILQRKHGSTMRSLAAFVVAASALTWLATARGGSPAGAMAGVAHSQPQGAQEVISSSSRASEGTLVAVRGRTSDRLGRLQSARLANRSAISIGPTTSLHFAPNGNFGTGSTASAYLPGADGFNLADVRSVGQLDSLPQGIKGLVWVGLCQGVDPTFTSTVAPFVGNAKVFGFYLMDDPDPTGKYHPTCAASHLKAESDWIHAHVPGTRTFILLLNLGSDTAPNYSGSYSPANSHIDLYGVDPYPCTKQFHGCNYRTIGNRVSVAKASGISTSQIVPVYQAFGGGRYRAWLLPTAKEEVKLLATWKSFVPRPVFDYAYSWGDQYGDRALQGTPALRKVFSAQNG
jgi:hypothetical protein